MGSLPEALLLQTDAIVHRWYEAWRRSEHPHPDVGEAALKNALATQLRLIGEQLRDLMSAEAPERLWRVTERLDPEQRVSEEIPIEEVVQEYRLVVEVVRDWIEERGIEVSFREYSYFYASVYELTAESVRRYTRRQADLVTRSRAEYLAGVMHQLRTPIAALATTIELLERGDRPPPAATTARLQRQLGRLRLLVESVLRLERFAPGELPLRVEEVFPARLVDDLLTDHEGDAIRKGLRFEAHVDRSLRLRTDPSLLLDALGNLVSNALKFTTSGRVTIQAEEKDDEVTFLVHDTGPGIPEEQKQRLFREVQPGSGGGAGIGLRIAHHAALALGGTIGVRSERGEGSTFWLRLPRYAWSRGEGGE